MFFPRSSLHADCMNKSDKITSDWLRLCAVPLGSLYGLMRVLMGRKLPYSVPSRHLPSKLEFAVLRPHSR